MKPITMEQVLKTFKEYFLMTVGMMLYSFAWIGCIMPADGTGGGATGLSRVLCHAVEHWAGISIQIGTMAFLINGVVNDKKVNEENSKVKNKGVCGAEFAAPK